MRITAIFAALAWLVSPCLANYTETFEGGVNAGGWTYGSPNGGIQSSGGHPGAFYRDTGLDTYAPQPHTTWGVSSAFTGNYRALGVDSVGIDLTLFHVDFSAEGRPLSVLLVSGNGTPSNFDDDWAAFYIGNQNIPLVGEGWRNYNFAIDSQSTTLPAGWDYIQFGPNSPPNPNWNDVITNVNQLRFFYGDPQNFFIFQMWDVGMDNVRISTVPEPNCLLALLVFFGTKRRPRLR